MGCTSGKVAKPTSIPRDVANAQHTLLSSPGKEGIIKQDDKPAQPSFEPAQPSFEGAWDGGVISGNLLTWENGSVWQIRTDGSDPELRDRATCCFTQGLKLVGLLVASFEGDTLTGELLADDRIYWNDGEVWSRYHVCASFQEYMGYIDHGPDLLVESMTLEQAKSKAATMPFCQGFTYEGDATHEVVKVYFKNHWNITGSTSGWRAYKKEKVACEIGDDVMAIFGPTGKRYPAEIQSICVDLPQLMGRMAQRSRVSCQLPEYSRMVSDVSQIVVSWKDGGNTHRVVSAGQVCKDAITCITDATLPEDNLQSVPDAELPLPVASPVLEVADADAGAEDAASSLAHPEEPSPSKTLVPACPKEASPSITLKQASTDVAQRRFPPSTSSGCARKEKSMCCC